MKLTSFALALFFYLRNFLISYHEIASSGNINGIIELKVWQKFYCHTR